MNKVWLVSASWALCATQAGCKKDSSPTPRRAEADAARFVVAPERAAEALAGQEGEPFAVEPKTGAAKPRLVLRLDYFPMPSPGRSTLPSCFAPFDQAFELGLVVCESTGVAAPLLASGVDQECYTDARAEAAIASQPVRLPGCQRAKVVTHRFDPPLLVHVEAK